MCPAHCEAEIFHVFVVIHTNHAHLPSVIPFCDG